MQVARGSPKWIAGINRKSLASDAIEEGSDERAAGLTRTDINEVERFRVAYLTRYWEASDTDVV